MGLPRSSCGRPPGSTPSTPACGWFWSATACCAQEVEAEVARLGLGDAVTLTGRIDDDALVRHSRRRTLFALPTSLRGLRHG